jgi:predicted AAA+ superfamily ATPase
MRRENLSYLNKWLKQANRKPLVLRGARQVGKTHLVRDFAKTQDLDLIEINFEFQPESISLFETFDMKVIGQLIKAAYGKTLSEKTLLFFDEIQIRPELFKVLRFFYESKVVFPIVAAGSLLEFALSEKNISVPVGRLEYHFLGPVQFKEYLRAQGKDELVEFIETFRPDDKIPELIHKKLSRHFQDYLSLGGMPEVIQSYLDHQDFNECDRIKGLIVNTYEDDFHKYRDRVPWERIRKVFRSIPQQLGEKFKYSKVTDAERALALSKALDLLCLAQVAHRIYHSHAQGLPLGSQLKENYFKVLFLDFGLSNYILGLKTNQIFSITDLHSTFKGALFEQVVGQHLLFSEEPFRTPELHTWAREKAQSSSELDYLIEVRGNIIPIEVKSGANGHLLSLHNFIKERSLKLGIRFNTEPPDVIDYENYKILSYPVYLATELRRICGSLEL